MATGTVSQLWRYPVKSVGGERVDALRVDRRGAGGDRTHAVWFEHKGRDRRLTAREAPRLLAWSAAYAGDVAPEDPPPATLTAPTGATYTWGQDGLRAALAADLGREIDLRRDPGGQQDLADSLLLTTQASLEALEAEMGAPVDLRRFRPNVHLDLDAPAWAESDWQGRRATFAGGVVLRLLHPCERCGIPGRDPDDQSRWPELLRHLARTHGNVFGINARVEVPGTIADGEEVTI